jgi:hypothetical protein
MKEDWVVDKMLSREEEVIVVLVVVLASKQGQFRAPLSARQERHG